MANGTGGPFSTAEFTCSRPTLGPTEIVRKKNKAAGIKGLALPVASWVLPLASYKVPQAPSGVTQHCQEWSEKKAQLRPLGALPRWHEVGVQTEGSSYQGAPLD